MKLKYGLDSKPSAGAMLLYGLQWFMICIPVVLTSTFIAPEGETVFFTRKMFAVMGVTMIIQSLWGHRLPLIAGPAAALLMGVITASAQGHGSSTIYPAMMIGGAAVAVMADFDTASGFVHDSQTNRGSYIRRQRPPTARTGILHSLRTRHGCGEQPVARSVEDHGRHLGDDSRFADILLLHGISVAVPDRQRRAAAAQSADGVRRGSGAGIRILLRRTADKRSGFGTVARRND